MQAITGTEPGEARGATPTDPPRPTLSHGEVLVDVSVGGSTYLDV